MEIDKDFLEHVKRTLPNGYKISSYKLHERDSVGPHEPRYILQVDVINVHGKQQSFYFNYKRLLRKYNG